MLRAFFLSLLLLAMLSSHAGELSGILRVIPEYHHVNQESLFFVPNPFYDFKTLQSRQEFEGRYQEGGLNLLATAITTLQENTKPEHEGLLNELYYDTVIADQEMSFGKKIMSWGVGYGFRPLDVVQQEDRRLIYSRTLEGVPLIAWEYFTDNGALTLAYINPLQGTDLDRLNEESLAFKYYYLWDNMDIHAVTRLSQRNKGEAGIGFTHIVNNNLEWHGSILYQHRYHKKINRLTAPNSPLLASDDPMIEHLFHSGIKALLGFTWSHAMGISVLGEFWFDNAAYSKKQWEQLWQLSQSQQKLLETGTVPEVAIYSNIGASRQFFLQPNLLQHNLLLQLSVEGDTVNSVLDCLLTPQDGGWVVTASLKHERNQQYFEFGVRTFGGATDSAFRAVSADFISYLSWQLAFAL